MHLKLLYFEKLLFPICCLYSRCLQCHGWWGLIIMIITRQVQEIRFCFLFCILIEWILTTILMQFEKEAIASSSTAAEWRPVSHGKADSNLSLIMVQGCQTALDNIERTEIKSKQSETSENWEKNYCKAKNRTVKGWLIIYQWNLKKMTQNV